MVVRRWKGPNLHPLPVGAAKGVLLWKSWAASHTAHRTPAAGPSRLTRGLSRRGGRTRGLVPMEPSSPQLHELETTQTPVSRGWTKKPGCVGEGLMPHGKAQQAAGTLGQTEPCGCRVAERCHLWRSSCQVTWPCAKVSSPAEGIAGDRVTGGGDC